ncbi:sporulation initiation factor Spo0A C-terminal domain-containing protein [Bacillus sp. 3255]|uniref:sporulation initiation factor Spo0A C-terminal domain-containing protein n=1 Tax=Bacillus sp. 3255 TaxID=2817904 RepID=UPI00285EAA28|nr:sporulation initiation factor Spo0A C-terminal domain-containing protein [Bacillus sp. 3255]MDR6884871.1 hypothetical protein [Bacillus sp. 3255]
MTEEQVEQIVRKVLVEILSSSFAPATYANDTGQEAITTIKSTGNLSKDITLKLNELGMLPHLTGYGFLREAILMVCEGDEPVLGRMGFLNSAIASKYNSSPSRVERAMRNAIEVWYDKNRNKTDLFKEKPTNGLFVATVSNLIKLKLGE